MKQFAKKSLALLLCVCIIAAFVPATFVSAKELEPKSRLQDVALSDDYDLTAIITFEDKSLFELNYSPADVVAGRADKVLAKITAKQNAFIDSLNGKAQMQYSYSSLFNGMPVKTTFETLKKIEKMDGVKKVYIANTYEVPKVENANQITGAYEAALTDGHDGSGVVVAVLDTGLNYTHELFQDYGNLGDIVLTEDITLGFEGNAEEPTYINDKVPFTWDYADWDNDVVDVNGHGTHCAGIAVGYAEDDLGDVKFAGTAPAAQLVFQKIFADDSETTDSGIYFAALDDCYKLNVDVISMSIGSPYGFTYDMELESEFGNIYKTLEDAGIVVVCAAGNEYSQGYYSENQVNSSYGTSYVLGGYTDYGTVGSPATYAGNIAVASVQNIEYYIDAFKLGNAEDYLMPYIDSSEVELMYMTFQGQKLELVYITDSNDSTMPSLGKAEDFEGRDLSGKIAVVSRGELTFQEKVLNAAAAGAAGLIVFNNVPGEGSCSMAIDDFAIPAIGTTVEVGAYIAGLVEAGDAYITFTKDLMLVNNTSGYLLNDFSNLGPTSDMIAKPQITGVGGYVLSSAITGDSDYVTYSGTSMAAPNVAGMFAQLIGALREQLPEKSKLEIATIAEAKLLSTAIPFTDEYGIYYSVQRQGAGIANVAAAINSNVYLANPISDGLKNVSLDGVFEISYDIVRIDATDAASYELSEYLMFDYFDSLDYEDGSSTYYNSLTCDIFDTDEYTLATNFENNVIDFAAGETVKTLEITVALSEDAIAALAAVYENGFYVNGYFDLYDAADVTVPAAHGSFLGFCGDWNTAPNMESFSSFDIIDIDKYLNDEGYLDQGYSFSDFVELEYGPSYIFSFDNTKGKVYDYFGTNIFDYFDYNPAHNAVSNINLTDGDFALYDSFLCYPVLYRNCSHVVMTVSDAETGEVYYVDDTPYARKNQGGYAAEGNSTIFMWDGSLTDDDGNIIGHVPSGTVVNVDFVTTADFEGAIPQNSLSFQVTFDYEAPELVYHYNAKSRTVYYTVTDNHYIQYINWSNDDSTFDFDVFPESATAGETYTDSFVVPEGLTELSFSVVDYASNAVSEYVISLDSDCTNNKYIIDTKFEDDNSFTIDALNSDYEYYIYDEQLGTYYTWYEIPEGETFDFTLTVFDGYTVTGDFAVSIGDQILLPDEETGLYSFLPTEDTVLSVVGIKDTSAPEIYLFDLADYEADPITGSITDPVITSGALLYDIFFNDFGTGIYDAGYYVSETAIDIEAESDSIEWVTADYDVIFTFTTDGSYILYTFAKDEAGNATYISVPFIVDNSAPVLSAKAINMGYDLEVVASDKFSEIVSLECINADGTPYAKATIDLENNKVIISDVFTSVYDITIIATDEFGNKGVFVLSNEYPLDKVAPVINFVLDGNPDNDLGAAVIPSVTDNIALASASYEMTFTAEGADPVVTTGEITAETKFTDFADGAYSITITAADVLGNVAESTFAFAVSHTPISSDETIIITGIPSNTDTDTLKTMFASDVQFFDKNGEALSAGSLIGTGCTVKAGAAIYNVVVLGDLTGDGKTTAADYLLMKRSILNLYTPSDVEAQACKITGKDKPSAADYLLLKRHILNLYNIYGN